MSSSSHPEPNIPTASWGIILQGAINRLILPVAVVGLVLWNFMILFVSWQLLPANDFGRMFASAELFVEGRDMYAATAATPAQLEPGCRIDLYNMNPPHFHLLLLPLTWLPNIQTAFVVWWLVSGLCFYLCMRQSLLEVGLTPTENQRRWALVLALAFVGTASMLFTGQLSFVLMVPLTVLWIMARRGHWVRAGALLGVVLSVKPFLGVLLAYFVWRRKWKAASASLAACAVCFGLGLLIFGGDNYAAWRARLAVADCWAWLPMNASLFGILTRLFTESAWYMPLMVLPFQTVWLLWVGLGGILGLITLAATGNSDSVESVDQDFVLLLVSSVLFCPLGWVYYLWLALPPAVPLLLRGWPMRQDPGAAQSRPDRWSWLFATLMLLAAFWPTILLRLFQPHALATLTLDSVYFWGLLACWLSLVRCGFSLSASLRIRNEPVLAPLDPADYRVSVVLPVFSETTTVREVTAWLVRELGARLHEIIIIQSPKSSEQSRAVCLGLVEEFPTVSLHLQRNNPGLGNGVREGMARASGNLVLMIDSDGEMEIGTVPRMLAEMAAGGRAMVSASRWLPGGGFSGYSGLKYYLNWCFQQGFRLLFRTRLTDLTYGFKLLRAELVHGINWQGTLHEIACETTLKPVRLGVSVAEVPSKWTARTQGVSKNSFWRNFRYVRMACEIWAKGVPFTLSRTSLNSAPPQPVLVEAV